MWIEEYVKIDMDPLDLTMRLCYQFYFQVNYH